MMEVENFVPDYFEGEELVPWSPIHPPSDASPPREKKPVRKLACISCNLKVPHLKKHVLKYHVSKLWWFLYPTRACWTCRRFEIASHVKAHGPFDPVKHMARFSTLVEKFIRYLL